MGRLPGQLRDDFSQVTKFGGDLDFSIELFFSIQSGFQLGCCSLLSCYCGQEVQMIAQ